MFRAHRSQRIAVSTVAFAGTLAAAVPVAMAGSLGTPIEIKPPAKSPVTVPGAHLKRGERLKSGELLIEQPYTIGRGEKLRVTFECPGRKKNAGIGFRESDLRKGVLWVDLTAYGKKTQKLTLVGLKSISSGQSIQGSIYSRCAVLPKKKTKH